MKHKHEPLDFHLSLILLKLVKKKRIWSNSISKNEQKGDFENAKVPNRNFSTKSVSD